MDTKLNVVRFTKNVNYYAKHTYTAHNYNGEILLSVDLDENSDKNVAPYRWVDGEDGYVLAIEHGGNHLDGTEYRRPALSRGAWCRTVIRYGSPTTEKLYFDNGTPSLDQVLKLLDGNNLPYLIAETRNPSAGKNNEWVPVENYTNLLKSA